jgi:hypothetical protein
MSLSISYFTVVNTTTGQMQQTGRKTNAEMVNIISQNYVISGLVPGITVPGTPQTISGGPLYQIGDMSKQYIKIVKEFQLISQINSLFVQDNIIRFTFLGGTTTSSDSILYGFTSSPSQPISGVQFNVLIANTNSQTVGDYFDIDITNTTTYSTVYLIVCILNGAWTNRTIISGDQCSISSTDGNLFCMNPSQSLQDISLSHFIIVNGVNSVYGINSNLVMGIEDDLISSSNRDYANVKLGITGKFMNDGLINDTGIFIPNCFVKGTKILCFVNDLEVYIPIEELTTDHYVKTYANGYKKLLFIKKYPIINSTRRPVTKKQKINKIYKLAKEDYAELFEDLYVNGGHSILVDTLTEEENRINLKLFGGYKKIGDKIRLLSYINQKAIPINDDFRYDMYHITTGEEEGIYANGILTESYNLENNIKM